MLAKQLADSCVDNLRFNRDRQSFNEFWRRVTEVAKISFVPEKPENMRQTRTGSFSTVASRLELYKHK